MRSPERAHRSEDSDAVTERSTRPIQHPLSKASLDLSLGSVGMLTTKALLDKSHADFEQLTGDLDTCRPLGHLQILTEEPSTKVHLLFGQQASHPTNKLSTVYPAT